jgi:hypothetical protein
MNQLARFARSLARLFDCSFTRIVLLGSRPHDGSTTEGLNTFEVSMLLVILVSSFCAPHAHWTWGNTNSDAALPSSSQQVVAAPAAKNDDKLGGATAAALSAHRSDGGDVAQGSTTSSVKPFPDTSTTGNGADSTRVTAAAAAATTAAAATASPRRSDPTRAVGSTPLMGTSDIDVVLNELVRIERGCEGSVRAELAPVIARLKEVIASDDFLAPRFIDVDPADYTILQWVQSHGATVKPRRKPSVELVSKLSLERIRCRSLVDSPEDVFQGGGGNVNDGATQSDAGELPGCMRSTAERKRELEEMRAGFDDSQNFDTLKSLAAAARAVAADDAAGTDADKSACAAHACVGAVFSSASSSPSSHTCNGDCSGCSEGGLRSVLSPSRTPNAAALPPWQRSMGKVMVDDEVLASWGFDPFERCNARAEAFGADLWEVGGLAADCPPPHTHTHTHARTRTHALTHTHIHASSSPEVACCKRTPCVFLALLRTS